MSFSLNRVNLITSRNSTLLRVFAPAMFLFILGGCAHDPNAMNSLQDSSSANAGKGHGPASVGDDRKDAAISSEEKTLGEATESHPEQSYKDLDSFRLKDAEGPQVVDKELETIPTEINSSVEKWINYFQGRGREHMERYLARSTRYEKIMKKVLRDNGLPEDLFYIALIESGFTSSAISHSMAVGYWQFIRGTGKKFGLEINKFIDERRDPVLATQAAADYFRGLYDEFGSWYLAMASYNVGEGRVRKEVARNKTRDFWELARKRRLPKETMNYVPKFIAARIIAKDPEKFGFTELDYLPPIEFDHIDSTKSVDLRAFAEKLNYNYEDLKALNPKYKGEIAPLRGEKISIRIPPGMMDIARIALNDSLTDKTEFVADSDTTSYKVRKGDTLRSIARKFRTSVAYLRDLNDLPRRAKLRPNSIVYVPDRTPSKSSALEALKKSEGVERHVVKSGETLASIAKKYSVSVHKLRSLNRIRKGQGIRVGMAIRVPSSVRQN